MSIVSLSFIFTVVCLNGKIYQVTSFFFLINANSMLLARILFLKISDNFMSHFHGLLLLFFFFLWVFHTKSVLQMVFYWSLSDSKSPWVSRIFLKIQADLCNAQVWIIIVIICLFCQPRYLHFLLSFHINLQKKYLYAEDMPI